MTNGNEEEAMESKAEQRESNDVKEKQQEPEQQRKALPIMVQGTGSDAGKSVVATALCRIFAKQGYRTAPFKSQNMSLNSYITPDDKEIGRAQGVQAEAAGVAATTDMNPILLKPTADQSSQVVVHGKPYRNFKAGAYRQHFFETGLSIVRNAYERLAADYERIVIEGAGSPVEINLNDRELVNMRVARIAGAPVILVADIDRGGVFAQLVGTLQLLEEDDRKRVIGVVINKFRGDVSLLQPGLDWFECYTGKPVLGVIPYIDDLHIEAEDSVILDRDERYRSSVSSTVTEPLNQQGSESQSKAGQVIDIAVIRYPRISNFTDVDPLLMEADCRVRFVSKAEEWGYPDWVILPGSKNTLEDLIYIRATGLDRLLMQTYRTGQSLLFGICGGYQMLGEMLFDPYHVESEREQVQGLGIIPMQTTLSREKETVRSQGFLQWNGQAWPVTGYQIHMGRSVFQEASSPLITDSDKQFAPQQQPAPHGLPEQPGRESNFSGPGWTDGYRCEDGMVLATYLHGIFENDGFRHALLDHWRRKQGWSPWKDRVRVSTVREQAFDRLAETVKQHVRLDTIVAEMERFARGNT